MLRKIDSNDEIPFSLLLLADETKEAIEKYIYQSATYILYSKNNPGPIGVFTLFKVNDTTVEIKNIAVLESFQGRGIGSWIIKRIKIIAGKEGFKQIIVGTPDAGTREISFYEKNGFLKYDTKKDFFILNYPEPIIEKGVMLRDMVMLKVGVDI